MTKKKSKAIAEKDSFSISKMQRRQFLHLAGASALAVGIISCQKEKVLSSTSYTNSDNTIDFKDDSGVLNYIYALEQLEAAFYIKAALNFPATFTAQQKMLFNDIRLHEIAHKEFFKKFLGAAGIADLNLDFSSVDFADATAVLNFAKTLEDLGVAAYNDALVRCENDYNLIILSQIATVEARHSAYVSSQVSTSGFADLNELASLGADASAALDVSLSPTKVLEQASKYIKTKLNVVNI